MGESIIIKADDFTYPSKEETKLAINSLPDLKNFGFHEYRISTEILFQSKPLVAIKKENDLFNWDICLLNRLGNLRIAYVNASVHYERYSLAKESKAAEKIHKFQFDFYSETAYYFLFSVRDTIFQIINLYFDLKIEENEVGVNTIKINLRDKDLKVLIEGFVKEIKTASDIRNSFTHRFPDNQKDYRAEFDKKDFPGILRIGNGEEFQPKALMKNLNGAVNILSKFINDLRAFINVNSNGSPISFK